MCATVKTIVSLQSEELVQISISAQALLHFGDLFLLFFAYCGMPFISSGLRSPDNDPTDKRRFFSHQLHDNY